MKRERVAGVAAEAVRLPDVAETRPRCGAALAQSPRQEGVFFMAAQPA